MTKIRTCLDCVGYSMDSGPEIGRTSLDYCEKRRQHLPTAAFCFDDLCCSTGSDYFGGAFSQLEAIAQECELYEHK
jgi:hypothetical protein